jgi:hypothetical protein
MGPTPTGNILVIYGHGGLTSDTFDFRRPSGQQMNLYSWTRVSIPVWDRQIQLAADDALANGTILDSYATVNSSRIGGTILKDYILQAPTGLAMPTLPAHNTPIPALGATIYHNNATLALSNRMLITVIAVPPLHTITLSQILANPSFAGRAFDVLWCACKS